MAGETSFGYVPETAEPASNPEAVAPLAEKVHDPSEMPPSLYAEANKVPLVLELVGGTSAYRHFDMEALTRETDRYILAEMQRQGLDDSREGYRKVLDAARERLRLPEGTDIYATVEALVRHFRIQEKLYSALREREELSQADPATLSAAKLKLYLEREHGLKQAGVRH